MKYLIMLLLFSAHLHADPKAEDIKLYCKALASKNSINPPAPEKIDTDMHTDFEAAIKQWNEARFYKDRKISDQAIAHMTDFYFRYQTFKTRPLTEKDTVFSYQRATLEHWKVVLDATPENNLYTDEVADKLRDYCHFHKDQSGCADFTENYYDIKFSSAGRRINELGESLGKKNEAATRKFVKETAANMETLGRTRCTQFVNKIYAARAAARQREMDHARLTYSAQKYPVPVYPDPQLTTEAEQ